MFFNDRRKKLNNPHAPSAGISKKPVKSAEEWMAKKPVSNPNIGSSPKPKNPHSIGNEQIKGIEKNIAERKKQKSQYNSINSEEHKRY